MRRTDLWGMIEMRSYLKTGKRTRLSVLYERKLVIRTWLRIVVMNRSLSLSSLLIGL